MAKVNLTLPNLDLDNLNDSQIIRKIASYLYIQNEQLRYELTHIDEDNMSSEESTSVQGMTQDQIRKAIEEAIRQNKDIDLSSNTVIVNMQRKMDNLAKLQAQDASNITRITQEMGNKVSLETYTGGLAGLKALISGNTALIGSVNTALQAHLTEYGTHKHQISIDDETGVISISGPRSSVTNPNISATLFFRQKVAEGRSAGYDDGKKEWAPYSIIQNGNQITVLNAEGDPCGGPYTIEGVHTTERSNAAYGLSGPEYMTAGTEIDSDGYYYYRSTRMSLKTLWE